MHTSKELTIVIPAKNEAKLLPRLLDSLARQNYLEMRNTRVFLADAASVDGTPDVARGYADRLDIQVIPGGLPSVGRNAGAKRADSRYILFIDADIELADRTLIRRALERMNRQDLHCLTTNIHCRDGKIGDDVLYACNNVLQFLSRFHKPFATGMFMLVEATRFWELGGFDERALYAEDYQLSRRFARRRFRSIRGGVYTTNRRFAKMGRGAIIRMFVSTALRSGSSSHYADPRHWRYWQS